MTGPGPGTNTGRSDPAAPAGIRPRAARAVDPADATGPLPFLAPADATGPLPAELLAQVARHRADTEQQASAVPTSTAPAAAPTDTKPSATGSPAAGTDPAARTDPGTPAPATAGPADPAPPGSASWIPPTAPPPAAARDEPRAAASAPRPPGVEASAARRAAPGPRGAARVARSMSVLPADATGPMPAIGVADAPGALFVEARPRSAPTDTGAWSFAPAPAAPEETRAADDLPPPVAPPSAPPRSWPTRVHRRAGSGRVPAPPVEAPDTPKRTPWPIMIVGALIPVAAAVTLVIAILTRADPAHLVTTVAADVESWSGAHYTGSVQAVGGGEIHFDLNVTAEGASGTLSRDAGSGTAEIVRDRTGTLLKGNREWWLYHHPTRADQLAGSWVADPLTETQEIAPVLELHPAALAQQLRGERQQWEAVEQHAVDGRAAVVLSDGGRRMVVGTDEPVHLLALDVPPAESTAPVQAAGTSASEAAAVTGAATRIRDAESPRTLTQRLLERPLVAIELRPDPVCATPTCGVTVVVTNSGTLAAQGRLEVSADGRIVATHPLDVPPGQAATFTAGAPNAQYGRAADTGPIMWEARAVDD